MKITKSKFLLKLSGNALTFIGIGIIMFAYVPIFYSEAMYYLNPIDENLYSLEIEEPRDTGPESENIRPYIASDDEFSIIIHKININAPIVPNVTTINQNEYTEALRHGVAHARGTALPGEKGNTFLFAHSSINFWELGPYATVFNLLNKLEEGDTVILLHNNRPYLYEIFDIEIVTGWNTIPFEQEYNEPVVTMVTCDPPGSTFNRRVIRAKMI